MNPLKVTHASITEKALLRKAESIPGAWNGIRIAALLLLLTQILHLGGPVSFSPDEY
jgi:hypothetical protein